jgi:two-component system response regulator FlrC
VVENDKQDRQLIATTLTAQGYHVIEAADAEEGLKAMRSATGQQTVDVVLCNLAAPSSAKDPLVQFLSQRPAVPVIMLADHPDLDHAAQMFRQGVGDYLVKPIQAKALLDVVRHAVELHGGSS